MRKTNFAVVAILIVLFIASVGRGYALDRPGEVPQFPPEVQAAIQKVLPSAPGDYFVVLKNGLTVLIRRDDAYDVVSAQVFVRAGSIYEGRHMTGGLSHYLEHVVAGGTTQSFTEDEARERLKNMGGASNAYTTFDRTVYYIDTSSDHWKDALSLLIAYTTENVQDPGQVTRERAVIQQEYKLGENNSSRQLWELFAQTAYRVHPVRYPVIGFEQVFVQQTREDLQEYYSSRYLPQNMVISVAGKVDPYEVLKFIYEKTDRFPLKAQSPVVLPDEPPRSTARWQEKELPIAQLTQAMVGFPTVSMTDPDIYALDVLAILLGEGQTSRLYQRLKEKEKQVLGISASNWTPSFVDGQLYIGMSLPPDNWPGVLKSVQEEVDYFKKNPADPKELEKAKKMVIASHVFGKETVSAMASTLASSYFDTGDPYFDEAYVENIRRVTAKDVQRVAQQYLDTNKMSIAAIHPPKSKEEASGGESSGAAATDAGRVSAPGATQQPLKPAESKPGPAAAGNVVASSATAGSAAAGNAVADNTAAGSATAESKSAPVEFSKMDNGMRLLLKADRSLPFVTIQLYGPGGLIMEKDAPPGISAFTASLLTAGTQKRSKLDIMRAIESVGGSIGAGSESNTYHVSVKVLKEDLDLALDILSDVVQNARFPEEEIARRRQDTLLAIQQQDENWQSEIGRMFKKNYFTNHPYAHDRLGTAESVKSFTRADILNFYHRMVDPSGAVLAVYGDINPDVVKTKIKNKFVGWKSSGQVALPQLPEETNQVSEDRVVEKKNEKSSAALFIGTDGLAISDKERAALDVLDSVLSGISYPTGRLEHALRGGNLDLVYTVHAFPFYGVNAGFFGVVTQTTLGNLPRVQDIILQNIKRLTEEPVPEGELETGKGIVVTMHHLGLESLGSQAQSAAVNEVLGLGWDYSKRYPEMVKAVTAQDVQNIAKKLFEHTLIVRTIPENPVEIMEAVPRENAEHVISR